LQPFLSLLVQQTEEPIKRLEERKNWTGDKRARRAFIAVNQSDLFPTSRMGEIFFFFSLSFLGLLSTLVELSSATYGAVWFPPARSALFLRWFGS
jgi:hypothetical protein